MECQAFLACLDRKVKLDIQEEMDQKEILDLLDLLVEAHSPMDLQVHLDCKVAPETPAHLETMDFLVNLVLLVLQANLEVLEFQDYLDLKAYPVRRVIRETVVFLVLLALPALLDKLVHQDQRENPVLVEFLDKAFLVCPVKTGGPDLMVHLAEKENRVFPVFEGHLVIL